MFYTVKKKLYYFIVWSILLCSIEIISSQSSRTCIWQDGKIYNLKGEINQSTEKMTLIQWTTPIQDIFKHFDQDPLSKEKSISALLVFFKKIVTLTPWADSNDNKKIIAYFLDRYLTAVLLLSHADNANKRSLIIDEFKKNFLVHVQTIQKEKATLYFKPFSQAKILLIFSFLGYIFNKKYTFMCQIILSLWTIVKFNKYRAITVPLNNVAYIDDIKLENQ